MLDIKILRDQTEYVKNKLATRKINADQIDQILSLDQKRRELLVKTETLKSERNKVSEEISLAKRKHEDASQQIKSMQTVGKQIKELDNQLIQVEEDLNDKMSRLPNLPDDSVPEGEEGDAREERKVGRIPEFNFQPQAHWDLGENLHILDFQRAAKVSGARFVYYVGLGAKLERAVYNFMLDEHSKEGYTEIIPPYMVNEDSMYGTGQFPKFKEDVFQIKDQNLTLIPTAEVPLVNLHRNEILDASILPEYVTALSPSFRSEAGSAGRDTRGLIRMHQFNKVEMVKFVKPENSYDELEKMTANAENILKKLELPYHVITLASDDMSFTAAKTYDLEVWMPSQNCYREISSCSNCEDFQARRAKIRFRDENGKLHLVHTLNGSGLAVGRTVAAILENYQNEDGSVIIPEVLVPYMNGIKQITV